MLKAAKEWKDFNLEEFFSVAEEMEFICSL